MRIYVNDGNLTYTVNLAPLPPGMEEAELVSCVDGVVRANKVDYKTALAVTEDTLHIGTNAEYCFYVCNYKAQRPDTSSYNQLKAAQEWVKTGRGFFVLGAMDVYIDNIDRTLEIYVDRGYTAKMDCGGVVLQVLDAISG